LDLNNTAQHEKHLTIWYGMQTTLPSHWQAKDAPLNRRSEGGNVEAGRRRRVLDELQVKVFVFKAGFTGECSSSSPPGGVLLENGHAGLMYVNSHVCGEHSKRC